MALRQDVNDIENKRHWLNAIVQDRMVREIGLDRTVGGFLGSAIARLAGRRVLKLNAGDAVVAPIIGVHNAHQTQVFQRKQSINALLVHS